MSPPSINDYHPRYPRDPFLPPASQQPAPVLRGQTPTSEVRIMQCPEQKTWAYKALVVLGRKVIEGGSPFQFGCLEAADEAADKFVQDVLKVLVHGEGSHADS